MTSECPDEAMFKAKYAEIAALKKALEQPSHSSHFLPHGYVSVERHAVRGAGRTRGSRLARFQHRAHPYTAPQPPYLNQYRAVPTSFSHNITAIFNGPSSPVTSGSAENITENNADRSSVASASGPQYIVQGNKLTLVGAALPRGHSGLFGKNSGNSAATSHDLEALKVKAAATRAAAAAKKHDLKFKFGLPADLVKTDNCDRIRIENNKYAIVKGGNLLVPLEFFSIQSKSKLIMWNGAEYTRKNGPSLRISKKSKRCVQFTA